MTSPARLAANRANARKSTGPKSPGGKAVAAQNALRTGVYSKLAVAAAAGESAADFDMLRAGVVRTLAPAGPLERELCDRVAAIFWRLRRVARYEAATLPAPDALPPHPDDVAPDESGVAVFRLDPRYPPWTRLAALRHLVRSNRRWAGIGREAAAWLAGPPDAAVTPAAGTVVTRTAGDLLGWPPLDEAGPWPTVLAAAGVPELFPGMVAWTGPTLAAVLDRVAAVAARDPAEFRVAVGAAAAAEADRLETLAADREVEEGVLAGEMLAERERAAAAAAYVDAAAIERVAKAEGHLSRELDRALAALERVRGLRASEDRVPPRVVQAGGGFALPPGG